MPAWRLTDIINGSLKSSLKIPFRRSLIVIADGFGVPTMHRMIKEVAYYHKEVQENESTLQEMKDNNKDAHDIKKFEEVLGESHMMIPDSTSRLVSTLQDLSTYLESEEVTSGDFDLSGSEWYPKAKEVLESEKDRLKDMDGEVPETSLDGLKDGEAF